MPAIECKTANEKLEALKALRAEFEAAVHTYAASGNKADRAAVYQMKARVEAAAAELRDAILEARFPNAEIRSIEIGGKTAQEYEAELRAQGHNIYGLTEGVLAKVPTAKERQNITTVRLTVADLGFKGLTTYEAITTRAKELGLDLCPAEVGPALRLAMKDQPMDDEIVVAMEAIIEDRYGEPTIFRLERYGDGSWLNANSGRPDIEWNPQSSFVFVPRKP